MPAGMEITGKAPLKIVAGKVEFLSPDTMSCAFARRYGSTPRQLSGAAEVSARGE
jgi:hypothetical protein